LVILSDFERDRKHKKVIKLKEIGDMNISDKMKLRIVWRDIYKFRKEYIENLKINDPETYEKIRKNRLEYYRDWRKKHPDYNKIWLRSYYKKYPEKFREYQRRYWRKRALSRQVKGD